MKHKLLDRMGFLAEDVSHQIGLAEHMSDVLASGLEVLQSIYNNQLQAMNNRMAYLMTYLTVLGTAVLVPNTLATIFGNSAFGMAPRIPGGMLQCWWAQLDCNSSDILVGQEIRLYPEEIGLKPGSVISVPASPRQYDSLIFQTYYAVSSIATVCSGMDLQAGPAPCHRSLRRSISGAARSESTSL